MKVDRFLCFIGCLFLTSCGYKVAGPSEHAHLETITVPYVIGDSEGQLTAELIKEISGSGIFKYQRQGGNLILKVVMVNNVIEKIGYSYDRDDVSGKLRKNLLAVEGRRNICAEITLIRASTEEVLAGPTHVTANADFDYVDPSSLKDLSYVTPAGKRVPIIQFSEGQLDTIEGAQDDAAVPLYRHLAKRIVDNLLNQNWLFEDHE